MQPNPIQSRSRISLTDKGTLLHWEKNEYQEKVMKLKITSVILLLMLMFLFTACDKDKPEDEGLTTAAALTNYWQYQTNLTAAMEERDGTMAAIQAAYANLETTKGKDGWAELDALVETYVAQSDAIASKFDVLIQAENAIVEYGDSKGLLSSLAKGIYNKAKDTVVSGGRMVRSGYRVFRGTQSLRQVLNDPNSGIPIVSSFAETVQKRNTARDALIRQAILTWDPITSPVDYNDLIPYDTLPGSTPQEKANAYLNLSDEDPIKMQTRAGVVTWDHDENVATAMTSVELGETGVKIVGDAYGGGVGEWTNEVLNQHMEEGQQPTQSGNLNVQVNQDGGANPPITSARTLIISKANMPDDDPRITVVMNSPQALQQPLPTGNYNILVMADGFIRNVYENLAIAQGQANNVLAKLLKLSENAIVIQNLSVDNGSITVGEPVTAHVSCVSTIGQALGFAWTVTGGQYTGFTPNGTNLTFTPTEEMEYTITVVVSDALGNSKTSSINVTSLGGKLVIDEAAISTENFEDDKLNPGENATIQLAISNTGTTDITGTHTVTGSPGFTVNFAPAASTILAGQTKLINVPVVLPANYSETDITLLYSMTTQNENMIPAIISDEVDVPVDFYVAIDPITDLVEQRVISITGTVSNPQQQNALLILDNDIEHAFDLTLTNGSFTQQIVLSGSTVEVQHNVRVVATAGGLSAENTIHFNSLIPVMALRATLTWDTNGTDVDFWITDPNGEKCYYGNDVTASGLTLDVDDTTGYGPENITTENIIPGDYIVQVHYYSDHDGENAIGTNCVVVIRQDEGATIPPVNYYGYLGDSGDLWNVTTLHYDAAKGWSVKPTNHYSKVQSNTLPAK